MMMKLVAVGSLLLIILATTSSSDVLYTLASPEEEESGDFGVSVSGAGDVNGDGYDDVVVGAWLEDPASSPTSSGRAYLFDGQTGALLGTLISPNEEYDGRFGCSVSGAGDVNGDGYDDVVVGAYVESPGSSPTGSGRAYVFDGQTSTLLLTLISPNEEMYGSFGRSVSGAGDVNGDSYDDVVIGAIHENPGPSPPNAGRAYVFDGKTGTPLYTLISPNEEESGGFGYSVSGVGDVNGDGYHDVIVGARTEDPGASPNDAGRAYVFDGLTGYPLYTLISPNEEFQGYFGVSVSGAGDVNGDGYDDMVIGACLEDPGASPVNSGRAYVFDGQTSDLLYTLISPNEEFQGRFGHFVSRAGDTNKDGYDDVVIGACQEDPGSGVDDAGRAYIFDGQTGDLLYTLISPNKEYQGHFGISVSDAGDANGDGYHDLVVGAYEEDPGVSPANAGRAYVYSWMHLSSTLFGNALELQWSPWLPASEYWIYGADNLPFFDPGFAPGYEHKLDEVVPPNTTWSGCDGVGDPDHNWTYIVMAVDGSENELARSNRCGEWDFEGDIP